MGKIIDYANLPRSEWPDIISRKEAMDCGLKRYFTGDPCKWGHVAERGKGSSCPLCDKARRQTPEYKAYQKAYQKAYHKTYDKAYRQTPEYKAHHKAYLKDYREAGRTLKMIGALSTLSQIEE